MFQMFHFQMFTFRPALSGTASTTLLQALAVLDLLRLWLAIPIHWTRFYHDPDISNESEFLCEWHDVFHGTPQVAGSLVLVVITLFRILSISSPHKAQVWCTVRNARIAICLCVFFGIIATVPGPFITWSFETLEYNYYGYIFYYTWCVYLGKYKTFMFWWTILFCVYMPFACIFLGNIFIIKHLYASKKLRRGLVQNQTSETSNKERSMSVILIAISFVFLISMMPYFLMLQVGETVINIGKKSKEYQAVFYLSQHVLYFLTYVNNVANIVCYALVGSTFKSELKALFRMKRKSSALSISSNVTAMSIVSQSERDQMPNTGSGSTDNYIKP